MWVFMRIMPLNQESLYTKHSQAPTVFSLS